MAATRQTSPTGPTGNGWIAKSAAPAMSNVSGHVAPALRCANAAAAIAMTQLKKPTMSAIEAGSATIALRL